MGTPLPPPQKGDGPPNFWPMFVVTQTAGWMKLVLGMELGLGTGDVVLNGDPVAPSSKGGRTPKFLAHVCCGQTAGWMKTPLCTEVNLDPGHIVLDRDPAPRCKRPISIVATVAHLSYC